MNSMTSRRTRLTYRLLSAFIAFTFSFTSVVPPSYAQSIASLNLPVPGAMVSLSQAFVPVLLKGMTIHPDNPLQFDFIIDSGNTNFQEEQIKTESERLVKYFLASMTIPKDDLWVNLSPYESDKIIPEELGKTELGRDMLAQDYILKQLTASLMYPEKELGKEFWDKVYKKAKEKYGTTEIPVNTFNKVWILPETATVYEHGQTVYIVEARLKVMLDSDYLAMNSNVGAPLVGARDKAGTSPAPTDHNLSVSTDIIREIILPAIEKEVNEGKNFAPLRQIYHSLILAKWYKETIKNSLLSQVYVDKKLINGIRLEDGQLKGEDGSIIDSQSSIVDQIYDQYMEAYKKGVFNYIKEDYDRLSNEVIPRKYFSGGEELTKIPLMRANSSSLIKESVGKAVILTLVLMTLCGGGGCQQKSNTEGKEKSEIVQQEKSNRALEELAEGLGITLKKADVGQRLLAVDTLGKLGKIGVPYLIDALDDGSPVVRVAAVKALITVGEPAIPLLLDVFREAADGSLTQLGAFDAIVGIGRPAVLYLNQALIDNNKYMRFIALRAFSYIGPISKPAEKNIRELLNSPDPIERLNALFVIDRLETIEKNTQLALKTLESLTTNDAEREVIIRILEKQNIEGGTQRENRVGDSNEVFKLLESANDGNFYEVKRLLEAGADLNAILKGATALILASQNGHREIVELLLAKGAQVNARGMGGFTALSQASYAGHPSVAEILLRKGAEVNTQNDRGTTPLFLAAQNGNEAIVKLLLDNNAAVDISNKSGVTPLLMASYEGHANIVKLLLQKKSNVNTRDNKGTTALMQAASFSRIYIVKLLLEAGADVNAQDDLGLTALYGSTQGGYTEIVRLLLDNGANTSLQDTIGQTPLFVAVQRGNTAIVKLLIDKDADINKRIDTRKYLEEYLLKGFIFSGQGQRFLNTSDFSVFHMAVFAGNIEMAELLLDQGVNVDSKTGENVTALMMASGLNYEKIVKVLINRGANVNIADKEGKTAMDYARAQRNKGIINLLENAIKQGAAFESSKSSSSTSLGTSSPITSQEAEAMIKGKLAPEHHHLISDTHAQVAMAYEGDFEAVYHAGPPERIEIVRGETPGRSSSLAVDSGQKSTSDEIRDTNDDKLGGIDMNAINLDREGAGVDIQFDPVELQELIDAGIDGFAPVIINITPLPSVLPLLGLEPQKKEDELEVSRLN